MKRVLFLLLHFFASSAFCQTAAPATQLEPPQEAPAKPASDHIRYLEVADGPDVLQTAITRFRKGDDTVDLVAVVHLGDAAYYAALNDFLARFDVVLYEMVGGEYEKGEEQLANGTGAEELGGVRQLQQMASSFLGLEFQLDGIDYEAKNFIHADVDWQQYNELMTAKNQSFATLFTRAMNLSHTAEIPGVPSSDEEINVFFGRILSAITTGDSRELKRAIAPMLSEAEGFIAMLEGDDGTVLVSERNKVVMEKLHEVCAKRNGGGYAVFYGAGHMPDLEERLLADGFARVETGWASAWSIPKSTEANSLTTGSEAPTATGILLRMLQDNPDFMSAVEQLSDVLEKLQETP